MFVDYSFDHRVHIFDIVSSQKFSQSFTAIFNIFAIFEQKANKFGILEQATFLGVLSFFLEKFFKRSSGNWIDVATSLGDVIGNVEVQIL
jgi:hypothetical protein